MFKKLLLLALLCGGLHLLHSCCGDDRPFFEFGKLNIQNEITGGPGGTNRVTFNISADSVEYFASILRFRWPGQLFATSCPDWGRNGLKDPVVDVEITADAHFSAAYPAGASLKPLFRWHYPGIDTSFHAFPLDTLFFEYGEFTSLLLRTTARPESIGLPYRFNITLRKSSGATVSGTSLPVTWQ